MSEGADNTGGWLHSLRRTGDSLLGLVQSRFELAAVELQEEKLRALNVAVWLVVALTFVAVGLLVGLGALAIYLWDVAGYIGLLGLSFSSLGVAAGVLLRLRHGIRKGPMPFSETIAEFRKDRECLRRDQ